MSLFISLTIAEVNIYIIYLSMYMFPPFERYVSYTSARGEEDIMSSVNHLEIGILLLI